MSSFVYLNAGSLKNILCALWVLVEKEKKIMPFLAYEKRAVTLTIIFCYNLYICLHIVYFVSIFILNFYFVCVKSKLFVYVWFEVFFCSFCYSIIVNLEILLRFYQREVTIVTQPLLSWSCYYRVSFELYAILFIYLFNYIFFVSLIYLMIYCSLFSMFWFLFLFLFMFLV